MSEYKIEWRKLLAVLVVLGTFVLAYFLIYPNFDVIEQSTQESELSSSFVGEPVESDVVRLKVEDSTGPVEDAEIIIDDSLLGTTDSSGLRAVRIPESEFELTVVDGDRNKTRTVEPETRSEEENQEERPSNESESETSNENDEQQDQDDSDSSEEEQESSEEDFTGIRMIKDLEPGETNRIEALENGEPLNQAEVMIDGETIGQTNEIGQIQFTVPDRSQITVEIEGLETEGFQIDGGSSSSVNLNDPADAESFTIGPRESQDIDFSFSKPENSSYRLYLNGEIYSRGDQASTTVQLSETLDPGSYTWFVRSDGQESESRSFEIVREGTSINLIGQATQVNGYILEMAFEIQGEASSYDLYVNDNLEKEAQVESTNIFIREFETSGDQDIRVEAFESGELQETLQRSFETSALPEATINWLNPEGSIDTTAPQMEYEIDAGTDYEYELYLNSQLVDVGEASGTNTLTFTPDPLPQGTHSYEVRVFDDNQREIGNTTGTFETTNERDVVTVNKRSYEFNKVGDSKHYFDANLDVHEQSSYNINVNETSVVRDQQLQAGDISIVEELGELNSGEFYNLSMNIQSDQDSKSQTVTYGFEAE